MAAIKVEKDVISIALHSFARQLPVVIQVKDTTVHMPIQNGTATIEISSDSVLVNKAYTL